MRSENARKPYLLLNILSMFAWTQTPAACVCVAAWMRGPCVPSQEDPLVAAQRNGCVEPLAAPRSEQSVPDSILGAAACLPACLPDRLGPGQKGGGGV